jgi:hypothetical protein
MGSFDEFCLTLQDNRLGGQMVRWFDNVSEREWIFRAVQDEHSLLMAEIMRWWTGVEMLIEFAPLPLALVFQNPEQYSNRTETAKWGAWLLDCPNEEKALEYADAYLGYRGQLMDLAAQVEPYRHCS